MSLVLFRLTVSADSWPSSSSSFSKPYCSSKPQLEFMSRGRIASFSTTNSPTTTTTTTTTTTKSGNRKLPVLLFDVMDTLVRDPFYHDVPAFFRMEFQQLIREKHPTAWLDFENGLIDEVQFGENFFKDGRHVDIEGLKGCMHDGYQYLDGIKALLHNLKQKNYEIHAFTNYPIWYTMIEDKLKLSTYLSWTFCSCNLRKRKPAPELFMEVSHHLGVDPPNCIFIDDRMENINAARNAGMIGLHFKDAASLHHDLSMHSIDIHASF